MVGVLLVRAAHKEGPAIPLFHPALNETCKCWVARVAAEIAVSRAEKLSRMRRDAGYCRVVAMG